MGKRTAAAAAAGSTASKKTKADPVVSKCDEVLASLKALPDMPTGVREMLAAALPLAMVPAPERHPLQESMITAVALQMAKVEACLQSAVEEAEAHVRAATVEKQQCAAAASAAEAALNDKKSAAQEKKSTLAKDAAEVRSAKAAAAEAEQKQQARQAELVVAERGHSELKSATEEVLKPLLDGSVEQDVPAKAAALVEKLQRLVHMEESLVTVAPAALSKPPAARGSFELMVATELREQCSKRLASFAEQVAAAEPLKAASAEAARAAQALLSEARGRQRLSAEAFTAARTEQEQHEASHAAAAKALKAAGPRLRSAEKALQDASGRLEAFRAGPAVSFAMLRTRTTSEDAADVAPAATPSGSSCAGAAAAVPVVAVPAASTAEITVAA